jgi:hypothetical protein
MMLCLVRRPGVFVGAVGGSKLDYRYKLSIVQALSLYLCSFSNHSQLVQLLQVLSQCQLGGPSKRRNPILKSSSASPDPTTEVACTNVGKVRLANLTQSLLHSRKAKQNQGKRETVRNHTLTCVVGLSFSLAGARGSLDSLLI